ncbi:MAG: YARHG domain-containing protein [Lachnospiraceae bacterium]|nr:YARHG domain-containing protein [Lachnospiraceae bacterium]
MKGIKKYVIIGRILVCIGVGTFAAMIAGTISDYAKKERQLNSDSGRGRYEEADISTDEMMDTSRTEEGADREEMTDEEMESTSGYIFPDSDSRYLTVDELKGFDKEQCRIARNEIYARHGRKFNDPVLREYFEACDWYSGTIEPEKFSESVLNNYETANRNLIVQYEKAMGYRN